MNYLQGGTEDTKETVKSNESSVSGSADGISKSRTLYELTAMVAHVHDEFEADRPFLEENEGHLVAHVKVTSTKNFSFMPECHAQELNF